MLDKKAIAEQVQQRLEEETNCFIGISDMINFLDIVKYFDLLAERDVLRTELLSWQELCEAYLADKKKQDAEREVLRKVVEAAREYKDEIGPDFESVKRYTLCRALAELDTLKGDT